MGYEGDAHQTYEAEPLVGWGQETLPQRHVILAACSLASGVVF